MNPIIESIKRHKIVVIYRGFSPEQCLEITQTLYAAGIRLFEVTLNSERAFESIELLSKQFEQASIGAGTVLTAEEVERAASAGAKYIISPNVNLKVVRRTKEKGLISIPGAFSPTEIQAAAEAGADIVKVFPISTLGAAYLSQVRGPLNNILYMPSGGLDAELAEQCFSAGATAIGTGVQLFGKEAISAKDWGAVTLNVQRFMRAAGLLA
ncbi:bifunctional 4-hydroxy-2-oxoglutarate aldolase/2-dehydro-3-deoxy-phosphogluconate aldolase [Paenibacillus sp. J2TS4]|uniref:bifunctional 4-hydroxy-2-oxoglutarate aldolase/2-dehydro-3-deoxy-phosphogluconate aldolase n=1 Tax=Paenibacillus sp. J2TS4 TaxID=2807194 RepID=UPI001B054DF5|nr:bifunctional 4-hydroxy-2-oxoglutarate aldolase/2-dehydro-3-deoxy-phosphogluconate aldolase [Paenibacillus sp. J2TS4]GIP36113.1 KHG-KDPG bifunctional aldolase [Paenibacillus sp. J2TS4]